jgi:porphobilinogen synthase
MSHFALASDARLRRLRTSNSIRTIVRENKLQAEDLIYPVFVCDGKDRREAISSMPGVERVSLDHFEKDLLRYKQIGIRSLLIFGIPAHKDAVGTSAFDNNGCVQRAIRLCKELAPEIVVISDICLCEFTDHGHCGLVEKGQVLNDPTLELLAKMALSHAKAGVDLVAPSSMMDGQVAAIRSVLDQNSFSNIPIMAYSAKFSSAFYGPFREAAQSAPQFGDRKAYQMDSGNAREALEEIRLDIEQGADIVMVKPGLAYLDILSRASQIFNKPLAVYNVSGEYSMIKAAAAAGYIDEKAVAMETLLAFKRAGAKLIISYFTPDAIKWLQ